MTKISIFEKEKDRLFAACFEPDRKDELDRALDFWRDFERLRTFFMQYEYQKLKAKSGIRKGMLRIYAVKFRDWYVITGSAIKLTDQMEGRPHLKKKLRKLELVRKLLDEGNVEGSFVYTDIQ